MRKSEINTRYGVFVLTFPKEFDTINLRRENKYAHGQGKIDYSKEANDVSGSKEGWGNCRI